MFFLPDWVNLIFEKHFWLKKTIFDFWAPPESFSYPLGRKWFPETFFDSGPPPESFSTHSAGSDPRRNLLFAKILNSGALSISFHRHIRTIDWFPEKAKQNYASKRPPGNTHEYEIGLDGWSPATSIWSLIYLQNHTYFKMYRRIRVEHLDL